MDLARLGRMSILCLLSLMVFFPSCELGTGADSGARSSLVLRFTDGTDTVAGSSGNLGAAGGPGVGASFFSDLVELSMRVVVIDDDLLGSSSGGFRAHIADLAVGEHGAGTLKSVASRYRELYLPSILSSSGRADLGEFFAGRRYLVLVLAYGLDNENTDRTAYGHTRFTTSAGENRVTLALSENREPLRQALESWYGIVLDIEALNVAIDLSDPSQPVINFDGQELTLNRTLGDTMNVTATAGFSSYEWYLNGALHGTGPALNVNSAGLPFGTHGVTLWVTDGEGLPYSAAFNFSVIN